MSVIPAYECALCNRYNGPCNHSESECDCCWCWREDRGA